MVPWLLISIVIAQSATAGDAEGPFVQSLHFVQTFGTDAVAAPENDYSLKATLAKALAKDKAISASEANDLMKPELFARLAGEDKILTPSEMNRALQEAMPKSREQLLPRLREHADQLSTTFDMIEESHLATARKLAEWMVANYESQSSVDVIVVCTGNSRRSMMGACMGNLAATYYGLDKVRFHSGGTAPSAFNERTVNALKAIGFEIAPTGEQAERGEPKTANPKYRVAWGKGLESIEYSKKYSDSSNPVKGFAAIMVCTEADSECPTVQGATIRLPMPFLDPKSYDDSKYESAKYAERRDDIGRTLMATMAIVSRKINAR